MSNASRILLADTPEGVEAFRAALATPFELVAVGTFERAKTALAAPPALVVCGCHFDEGRMYDLLRYLKATPGLQQVPFMAVRAMQGELEDALYESVKIAVRALGGNAFVDLLRWRRRWGEAEASHRLTHLVQTLVNAAGADSA